MVLLHHADAARRGRGRTLPGRHVLPDAVVRGQGPRQGQRNVPARRLHRQHCRGPAGRAAADLGRARRPARLAVDVPRRRTPGLRPRLRRLEEAPGPPQHGNVPHRRGSRRSRGPHRRRGDRRRRGLRQPPAPRCPEGQADPPRRRRLLHPPDRRLRPVLLPALHHRHVRQAQPAADRPADGHPVDLLRGGRPAGPPLRHRRPPLPDAGHRHHDRHRRRLRPRRRRRAAARA